MWPGRQGRRCRARASRRALLLLGDELYADFMSPHRKPGVADLLGKLTLGEEIGRGRESVVHGAQVGIYPPLAVKVWDDSLSARPALVARVLRVAERIQAIDHPNLVRIHQVAVMDGRLMMVMERMEESLDARLGRGSAFAVADALDIAADVTAGLAALHEAGIVHGDVKPSNILRVADTIKLGDFGVATELPAAAVGGTLAYASPEQCLGALCDGRSDLYSLGVVLYEMLTGWRPFASIEQMVRRDVIPLAQRRPDLDESIVRLVDGMLAASPDERVASAGELAGLLSATARSERLSAPACSPGAPYGAAGEAIHRVLPAEHVPQDPRVRLYRPGSHALVERLGRRVAERDEWRRLRVIRVSTPHGDVHVTAENAHAARAIVDAEGEGLQLAGRLVFHPDSSEEVAIPYYAGATYQLGSDPYTLSDVLNEWYVLIDAHGIPGLIGQIRGGGVVEYLWHGREREIRERRLMPGQTIHFSNLVPMRLEPRPGPR
jgi:hypothetical protein